jgi:hypothetical protein
LREAALTAGAVEDKRALKLFAAEMRTNSRGQ